MLVSRTILLFALAAALLPAQWRRLGNAALDLQLSGVATGPMDRVGFSADGARLAARAGAGQWFATANLESWDLEAQEPALAAPLSAVPDRLPEPQAIVRASVDRGILYAAGRFVWRSEDGGRSWTNLTQWRQGSLLGAPAADLAVSPRDSAEIAVAAGTGIWRSADGGRSWSSLNAALPHLPIRRILSLPRGSEGARVTFLAAEPWTAAAFEWQPGERTAWRPAPSAATASNSQLLNLSRRFNATVTVVRAQGDWVYAGASDGRIWVSMNRGADWSAPSYNPGATVEAIAVDERDPRRAVAGLARQGGEAPRAPVVLRTLNGGMYWDDATTNLPESAAFGIAADFVSGALYAATLNGIYQADLNAPSWTRLAAGDLPAAPVLDLRLDPAGNQLYAAVYGYGVYTTLAPHRRRDPRVVHVADAAARPAAPGALLSVLGARVTEVRAGNLAAAVLPSPDSETHVQLPYELSGAGVQLSFLSANQRVSVGLALQPSSPAIFIDPDGAPLALDAQSGILLDQNNPARAGGVIQILASGLGRVTPEWPAGRPAPQENRPRVVANVEAALDGTPLEVLSATLAPGYTGFYLVEVKLPTLVNRGPAEFVLSAGNVLSNRVRLYLEP